MCIVPGRGFSGLSGRHYVVRLMEHKDDGYLLGLQRDTRLPATTGPTRLIMQSCSGQLDTRHVIYYYTGCFFFFGFSQGAVDELF